MNEELKAAVAEISAGQDNIVTIPKAGKKPTTVKDAFNIIATTDDRNDLIAQGWNHRGVVGGNVYFKQGEASKKDK